MINWDSLTMEKVVMGQPMSKTEILMFTIIAILTLLAFLSLSTDSNSGSDSKSKTFNGDLLLAIMIATIFILIVSYFRARGGTDTEFYKISVELNDPKITSELLDKTKDREKLNRDPFERVIFNQFKVDESKLYFKDKKLYVNIYMHVSDYEYIKTVSEFKNIVLGYITYELKLRKDYKSPEELEKEKRQMKDYLEERLVKEEK